MAIKDKRKDTVIRVSKWLDKAIEEHLADRKTRINFPSKRNFVDIAVMKLLEEEGVTLGK